MVIPAHNNINLSNDQSDLRRQMLVAEQADYLMGFFRRLQFEIDTYRFILNMDRENSEQIAGQINSRDSLSYHSFNSEYHVKSFMLNSIESRHLIFRDMVSFSLATHKNYSDVLLSTQRHCLNGRHDLKTIEVSPEGQIILLIKTSSLENMQYLIDEASGEELAVFINTLWDYNCIPDAIKHLNRNNHELLPYEKVRGFIMTYQNELIAGIPQD